MTPKPSDSVGRCSSSSGTAGPTRTPRASPRARRPALVRGGSRPGRGARGEDPCRRTGGREPAAPHSRDRGGVRRPGRDRRALDRARLRRARRPPAPRRAARPVARVARPTRRSRRPAASRSPRWASGCAPRARSCVDEIRDRDVVVVSHVSPIKAGDRLGARRRRRPVVAPLRAGRRRSRASASISGAPRSARSTSCERGHDLGGEQAEVVEVVQVEHLEVDGLGAAVAIRRRSVSITCAGVPAIAPPSWSARASDRRGAAGDLGVVGAAHDRVRHADAERRGVAASRARTRRARARRPPGTPAAARNPR